MLAPLSVGALWGYALSHARSPNEALAQGGRGRDSALFPRVYHLAFRRGERARLATRYRSVGHALAAPSKFRGASRVGWIYGLGRRLPSRTGASTSRGDTDFPRCFLCAPVAAGPHIMALGKDRGDCPLARLRPLCVEGPSGPDASSLRNPQV